VLRVVYVADPADAGRIDWGRCELPNERGFMKYWNQHIYPSIKNLDLTAQGFAKMQRPVLTIHGVKDRSAAYGGGRDWAAMLPAGRLLTVENGGHAPWIEAPETVFGAIETFLGGNWPEAAERITTALA
jgi:pimeloyl-ACP methyl ester carboxylesterase